MTLPGEPSRHQLVAVHSIHQSDDVNVSSGGTAHLQLSPTGWLVPGSGSKRDVDHAPSAASGLAPHGAFTARRIRARSARIGIDCRRQTPFDGIPLAYFLPSSGRRAMTFSINPTATSVSAADRRELSVTAPVVYLGRHSNGGLITRTSAGTGSAPAQ